MRFQRTILLLLLFALPSPAFSEDSAALCADRASVERVYYNHRLGQKPPFEQALPPATLEKLVRFDLSKEAALRKAYGVEITSAMLNAEVQRIDTTTRAPDLLAEIKTALGNDPCRFARAMARPVVVERVLRAKFDNDDALHVAERRLVEQMRDLLLTAKTNGANCEKLLALLKGSHPGAVTETIWQLGARPAERLSPENTDKFELKKRFGPNAQILSSPRGERDRERKSYFADLPDDLQRVLRVQLRGSGDVSAVIETPGGFLLYVATDKTDALLGVACLSLPKRSYEQWLEEQNEKVP